MAYARARSYQVARVYLVHLMNVGQRQAAANSL